MKCFVGLFSAILFTVAACGPAPEPQKALPEPARPLEKGSFGYDLEFLKRYHSDMVLLTDARKKAQVIVIPAYQGRVMSSSTDGADGISMGWVNYDRIATGKPPGPGIQWGGEDRFWLGPDGGQFSLFFKKGSPQTVAHRFIPTALDTEPFRMVKKSDTEVRFEKNMELLNFSGTAFKFSVQRTVRLLDNDRIESLIEEPIPEDVEAVAFESENIITNTGYQPWTKETGLLSVRVQGIYNASDRALVAIPYKEGTVDSLGEPVYSLSEEKIPEKRLKAAHGLITYKTDGKHQDQIGINWKRATPVAASWDPGAEVLSIRLFTIQPQAIDYVGARWEIQKNPFDGELVVARNGDGGFYEVETSSPAAALKPGESMTHVQRTIHLKGKAADLREIAFKYLGVPLEKLKM